ncbi:MAG: hypothetical protein U5K54_09180 [Cytophagales bacterium]|nr:hypothetical protein [Cytophagales bacterium]
MVYFDSVKKTLQENQHKLSGVINDKDRKTILDGLGIAASQYRLLIYDKSFENKRQPLLISTLQSTVDVCLTYLEHTINANKRQDDLYHAYNLMTVENDQGGIYFLPE